MLTEDNRRLIMRNRMGGVSAAAIAGAAIVMSLAASPALAEGPGGAYFPVSGFRFGAAGVEDRRHTDPQQQDDDRADGAIPLVVRANPGGEEGEPGRADQPQQCCRDPASAEAMPARLSPGRRIAV